MILVVDFCSEWLSFKYSILLRSVGPVLVLASPGCKSPQEDSWALFMWEVGPASTLGGGK